MSDIPNPLDSTPQVSAELRRAKLCALCDHPIAVFDKSAGCQDPERSHPECDRLDVEGEVSEVVPEPVAETTPPTVEAPVLVVNPTVDPDVTLPTEPPAVVDADSTPVDPDVPQVEVGTTAPDPGADPTEYQPPVTPVEPTEPTPA